MKKLILIPFLAFAFTAAICNKSDDSSSDLKKKELELKEKELKLKEKELDMKKNSQSSLGSENGSSGGNSSLYPQASERLLTGDDVSNMSGWDLKIMRNEIFARHGYIFKSEEMRSYFSYEKWYTPRYENVDDMITDVEKKNIELIKRYESRAGNNDYSR
ncbi:MAG: YARHG domain-containing protein [Ignavibacteria bacterium]